MFYIVYFFLRHSSPELGRLCSDINLNLQGSTVMCIKEAMF